MAIQMANQRKEPLLFIMVIIVHHPFIILIMIMMVTGIHYNLLLLAPCQKDIWKLARIVMSSMQIKNPMTVWYFDGDFDDFYAGTGSPVTQCPIQVGVCFW